MAQIIDLGDGIFINVDNINTIEIVQRKSKAENPIMYGALTGEKVLDSETPNKGMILHLTGVHKHSKFILCLYNKQFDLMNAWLDQSRRE